MAILLSSHQGLGFQFTHFLCSTLLDNQVSNPITYYWFLWLLSLLCHPDPSSLSMALEGLISLASLEHDGDVLVFPRNKPVCYTQGIVAGSEKEI